jgi:Flp pilus assembly pilin Flp
MLKFFKRFAADDDGAVTVDWVVLTAFVVVLGLFVASVISEAVRELAVTIASDISTADD